MPLPGWSTGCWLRRGMASAGEGTGWTWRATPTRRAMCSLKTGAIRMPIRTAITSLRRSMPTWVLISSSCSSSRPINSGSGKDRGPLAAMGFLTVGRRFLLDQNEIIDDRIDVVTPRVSGFDGHMCPLPRSQVRSDSHRRLLLALRCVCELGRAGRAADAG